MRSRKSIPSFLLRYVAFVIVLSGTTLLLMAAGADKQQLTESGNARDTTKWPLRFDFGRTANLQKIATIDIDVRPDGKGLPAGSGSTGKGSVIYNEKCASCHGKNGNEGPYSVLAGPMGDTTKAKTIGNYWPYATTLFDYIRRAMPYNMPGSLGNAEVYHLTAFLLYKNKIIDSATVVSEQSLPKIRMPALKFFVNDDRHGGPEVK